MSKTIWFLLVSAVLVTWFLSPDVTWKYLFFLRLPILMSLLLILLPKLAEDWLPAMLKNLFVLRGKWQLTFVIASAVMAGMAVVLVAYTILLNAPERFDLPTKIEIPESWQYGLAIALGLPICLTATNLSKQNFKKLEDGRRWTGVIVGGILSAGLLILIALTRKWLYSNIELKQLLVSVISLARQETGGYINPQTGDLARGHLTALAFLLVGGIVYLAAGLYFNPKSETKREEAPALLYLLLIISMVTLFYGGATFYFDYFRVPTLILFFASSAFAYLAFDVDHLFQLKKIRSDENNGKRTGDDWGDFKQVLEKRLYRQVGERTLVIVCASGGGIQAAGWTAQVLTGLQKLLGTSFTQAIGLISSVSGGSVGSMYYLDRFSDEGYPKDDELENIFTSATKDSLDAVGWGLAYLDLWRFIGLPFLIRRKFDRGTAMERDWQGEMKSPKTIKTLATWRKQIFEGKIPIPVFNATLVEDGRRFLITPMTFGEIYGQAEKKYVDFNTLYGAYDYDMDVVTAARLSATFPYASPICRSDKDITGNNYHIADGGYFDNSGFVTAVEWLDEWLKPEKRLNIKRVLVLQINAFPESSSGEGAQGNGGWFMATFGPLLAMFKVRDPVLAARNATEANLLIEKWKNQVKKEDQVDIRYFPVFFPSKSEAPEFYKDDQYQPPLSWKLTDKEKDAIKKGWEAIAKEKATIKSAKVIQDIRKVWHETWKMPKD